ncbi:HAD family hydrolase [Xenorhabdus sp. PB62.4]|uniref:HAD family hydrolase n=1 Tax=Xenorhabdus sp. PB62.4 TaxID=1851573 RepID=UPI001656EEB5|nr:HAD family hydrolase [Xenorhabdus sp. PB62.4]MBC8953952.1 hydrolase [Xenorhabdus sp. PB62.4]
MLINNRNEESCIVFDLDGTLVNTWNIHLKTLYETSLEITGLKHSKLDIIHANKITERETLSTLLGKMDSEYALEFYIKKFMENLNSCEIEIFPGIENMLISLDDAGCKIGLFTGRKRDTTISLLKKLKLIDYFKSIITSDDVINSKPSTEGLIKVIKELKGNKEKSLYIGDTLTDIEIARATNITSIFVNWNRNSISLQKNSQVTIVDDSRLLLLYIKNFLRINK